MPLNTNEFNTQRTIGTLQYKNTNSDIPCIEYISIEMLTKPAFKIPLK
jgi:hypothetical protein